MDKNKQTLTEAIYDALSSTWNAVRRNSQSIVNLIAVVTAVVVLSQSWFAYQQRRLVLFVGPTGSSTANVGPDLVEQLRKTRDPSGVNYIVELEQVPNGVSIRERMAMESSRIPLGIIEDGPSSEPGERTDFQALLPMEWDYLFVLCSRKLLKECTPPGKAATSMTLRDVADRVGKGKLFLGPKNSTSYVVATAALKKYGDPRPEQQAIGFSDWEQMKAAFKTEQLDLGFYSGPLGADLISDLADDGNVVLLGLGDTTDAIQYETGFQMHAAQLPENLGRVLTPRDNALRPKGPVVDKDISAVEQILFGIPFLGTILASPAPIVLPEVPFCGSNLTTLASRRVLACPSSLSTADGYLLAQVARSALESNEFNVNLNATDPPYHKQPKEIYPGGWPLRMRRHPALELLQKGQSPTVWRNWTTWPSWLQSAALGLIGLLAFDMLRWLTKLENSQPDTASAKESPPGNADYQRLERLLNDYEKAIDEKTYEETARERATWDNQLRDIRKAIHSTASLSASEREILQKRFEVLKADIETSMIWVTQSPTKRPKAPVEAKSPETPSAT